MLHRHFLAVSKRFNSHSVADPPQSTAGKTGVAVVFRPMARTPRRRLRHGKTRSADREWPHGGHFTQLVYIGDDLVGWFADGTGAHNPRRDGDVLKRFQVFGAPPPPDPACSGSCRHPTRILRSLRCRPRAQPLPSSSNSLVSSQLDIFVPVTCTITSQLIRALVHEPAVLHIAMSTHTPSASVSLPNHRTTPPCTHLHTTSLPLIAIHCK
jgi:hypothetical protein